MSLVRGIRVINAIQTGNTSAACLTTLLSDSGRCSDFSSVMVLPGQVCVLASSTPAMCAIANSCIASTVIYNYAPSLCAMMSSTVALCQIANSGNSVCAMFSNCNALNCIICCYALPLQCIANSTVALTALSTCPANTCLYKYMNTALVSYVLSPCNPCVSNLFSYYTYCQSALGSSICICAQPNCCCCSAFATSSKKGKSSINVTFRFIDCILILCQKK